MKCPRWIALVSFSPWLSRASAPATIRDRPATTARGCWLLARESRRQGESASQLCRPAGAGPANALHPGGAATGGRPGYHHARTPSRGGGGAALTTNHMALFAVGIVLTQAIQRADAGGADGIVLMWEVASGRVLKQVGEAGRCTPLLSPRTAAPCWRPAGTGRCGGGRCRRDRSRIWQGRLGIKFYSFQPLQPCRNAGGIVMLPHQCGRACRCVGTEGPNAAFPGQDPRAGRGR